VFIQAGLLEKAAQQRAIAILEAGFGTGLNAFLTLLEAEKRHLQVTYCGLELYPIAPETAAELNYAAALQLPERHADFLQLHTCPWDEPIALSPHFRFEKRQLALESVKFEACFDLIYFDAFAPQTQPELWGEDVLRRMYQALRPGGILVTYCTQGDFRRTLKNLGFAVKRLNGYGEKWHMTRGVKRF
jgi:tRNA U34 5-methylaminomethyl-2-thiouridine-forming methyltransferase MnmC